MGFLCFFLMLGLELLIYNLNVMGKGGGFREIYKVNIIKRKEILF